MNRYAVALVCFSLCFCVVPAARAGAQDAQPEPCTNRDVGRGVFGPLEASAKRCPLPDDAALIADPSVLTTLADPAAGHVQLLDAMRALAMTAGAEGAWGKAFAQRVMTARAAYDPKSFKQIWDTGFARVSTPLPFQSECGCAFVAASDGDAAYACYRFPQPDQAAAPACNVPRLAVYDLPDWSGAARALRFHQLVGEALVKLSAPAIGAAITRLERAEQRWQALTKNGLVQYPWELWISRVIAPESYANYSACFASDKSCDGQQGLDPNRVRFIFLHPGIGFGFPGFGKHDGAPQAKAHLVVAAEAFGVALYPETFKWYLGLSAGVGFQDADFADPRLGGFVHITRWLQAGYLHGVTNHSKHAGTLYLTVDALGWLNRSLGWLDP